MNQLLKVKREMFRVELRKKQNEDLFKRKRKSILDINRDYKAILAKTERDFQALKPQNQEENELFWLVEHDIPNEHLSDYLDCYIEATSYPNQRVQDNLFENISNILHNLFEEISHGGSTENSCMLEDCLLILYNLNIHAVRLNKAYILDAQTKRVLYQLLIIYTTPEAFKIALKVVQAFIEQLEESLAIIERCLTQLNDTQDDEIINICLETINIYLTKSQTLQRTPQIPIIRGIYFLNTMNPKVRYQILFYYAKISSFESQLLNHISKETILTVQKIFLQESNQDLLIHALVFIANSCTVLMVVDEITRNLVLLNKMKLLLQTPLFPEAWNLCCILIWSGGDDTINIFNKLDINNEIINYFVEMTNTYQINQLLEAMIGLKDLRYFMSNNFVHKLQNISISVDEDGCAMSNILLQGI